MAAPIPGAWAACAAVVVVHLWTGVLLLVGGEGPFEAFLGPRSPADRLAVGGQGWARVDAGEVWRLATSVLLHVDALHLLFNVTSLWAMGRMVEPWVGPVRWWGWFTLGGLGGSLASQWMGLQRSDGASAGAFALLGAAMVLGWRERAALSDLDRRLYGPTLWAMTVLNLVLSFVLPFIDATSHVAGLAIGLVCGAVPRGPREERFWGFVVGVFIGLAAIGWGRS